MAIAGGAGASSAPSHASTCFATNLRQSMNVKQMLAWTFLLGGTGAALAAAHADPRGAVQACSERSRSASRSGSAGATGST